MASQYRSSTAHPKKPDSATRALSALTLLNYKRLAEIEQGFRTLKGIDLSVRPIRRGKARMGFVFTFTMAAYDLVRLPTLFAEANA